MQKNTMNLQDPFLSRARRTGVLVTVFLMNGFQMHGTVSGYDSFVVVLDSEGKQQMIYKHRHFNHHPHAPHRPFRARLTRGRGGAGGMRGRYPL